MRASHETADPRLVEALTGEAPVGDPLARGARRRVHARERRLPARPLRRRVAKRLLQVGDRTGHAITKALREAHEAGSAVTLPEPRARRARADGVRLARVLRRKDGEPARSTPAPSCSPPAAAATRRPQARHELSTNHPNATGEVTRSRSTLGAEARDLDALQYHPNGGAWPATMQGYSIPETTRAYGAVLLNADGEEFTDSLGAARRGLAGDRRRGRGGPRRRDRGRPARGLPRHDADRGGRRRDLAAVHAAPLPRRGHRPARRSRSSPTPSSTTRTAAS